MVVINRFHCTWTKYNSLNYRRPSLAKSFRWTVYRLERLIQRTSLHIISECLGLFSGMYVVIYRHPLYLLLAATLSARNCFMFSEMDDSHELRLYPTNRRGCWNIWYPPKTILISNLAKTHFRITYIPDAQSFWHFEQNTVAILPCYVQKKSKTIGHWSRCYGQTWFREIWINDEFRMGILYFIRSQNTIYDV